MGNSSDKSPKEAFRLKVRKADVGSWYRESLTSTITFNGETDVKEEKPMKIGDVDGYEITTIKPETRFRVRSDNRTIEYFFDAPPHRVLRIIGKITDVSPLSKSRNESSKK